jgi:hypothetical protein
MYPDERTHEHQSALILVRHCADKLPSNIALSGVHRLMLGSSDQSEGGGILKHSEYHNRGSKSHRRCLNQTFYRTFIMKENLQEHFSVRNSGERHKVLQERMQGSQ